MKSDELPRDLETRDETTPPPSSPGVSEHVLLTQDTPEDLKTNLLLCSDQSFPDYPVFGLGYLPCYRTSRVFISPSAPAALHIDRETEESFNEGKVITEQDGKLSYWAISTGYFPCYRTYEDLLSQPLTNGLNAEGKKPDNNGKDESEGEVGTTVPSCLGLDKRALRSLTDEEPPVHQPLRDSTSEDHLSTTTVSSGLPVLNQPFPCSKYSPHSRTEGDLCAGPTLGHKFSPGTEYLENKEEGERGGTSICSLLASCFKR